VEGETWKLFEHVNIVSDYIVCKPWSCKDFKVNQAREGRTHNERLWGHGTEGCWRLLDILEPAQQRKGGYAKLNTELQGGIRKTSGVNV
jgi:hypothetical protein